MGVVNPSLAFPVYHTENLIQRSVSNLGDKPKKKYPQRFCGTHTPVNSRGLALGQTLNSLLDCKKRLLSGKKSTLGDAALSLHYANVIIFIERLAISPHFISPDSREILFIMVKLHRNGVQRCKEYTIVGTTSHNMIKWHTERNFEKQRMGYGGNVLLVNTLHYADQVKTEDAITDLVLSLHYISRFGREVNDKAFTGSSCGTHCDDYLVCNRNIMSL
ncbi:ferredoxin-dependent glutamate synthase [Tanacetum coccineum]